MGRAKQVESPHHKSSINKGPQPHTKPRRKSSILTLISPADVTEETLQVWRTLPSKIRQDPSLAPFQNLENERFSGMWCTIALMRIYFFTFLDGIDSHF